jgi:exopolysaccharide biosynthesis predicted pyruvyltransferase EpsI
MAKQRTNWAWFCGCCMSVVSLNQVALFSWTLGLREGTEDSLASYSSGVTSNSGKVGRSKEQPISSGRHNITRDAKSKSAMPTKYRIPKGVSPSISKAPTKTELFETDNAGIRKRHECIAKIRERTLLQLGPHIQTYSTNPSPALLVDPAFHPNVGDNMIYVGEREFIKSLGFSDASIEICSYRQAVDYAKKCWTHLEELKPGKTGQAVAYWHGGGNWGDLYPFTNGGRISSFEGLLGANYSVLSMPQSYHYSSATQKANDTQVIINSIAAGLGLKSLESETDQQKSASRVTFTWREITSFEEASKEYPFATNLLVPDIAFHLGPYQPLPSVQKESLQLDILLFLREDKESVFASSRNDISIRRLLNSIHGGSFLKFGIADWNTRFAMWPSQDFLFTDSAIQLLALGRVAICDRLHAAILCYISGIPFIFVDQSTKKLTKTLRVAFDSWEGCNDGETAMWARAESLEEALALAVDFLEKYDI